jgi:predicted nuclease with RNAse H fold
MGVDVGGKRKQFDVALIDDARLLGLRDRQCAEDVAAWVTSVCAEVVAIDSPRSCAPPGHRVRPDERDLRAAVCGIRWTPPREQLDGSDYYEWIREGLHLYEALTRVRVEVIECFPTASWTRWFGTRGTRPRSAWTREALGESELDDVPARTNQDQRDAIAAALTARDYGRGRFERFGEIVVPAGGVRG